MYEIGEAYSFTPAANIEKSAGFGKELNLTLPTAKAGGFLLQTTTAC